jgi:predicted DNA-binding transcriptional regulator YafY
MPRKKDPDQNYGQKLLRLFTTLLYSGEPKSLIELSKQLNCSKQTVMKIINDITSCFMVQIEDMIKDRRKYYCIKAPKWVRKPMAVTSEELAVLEMCRNFTRHLLGRKLFEDAAAAIGKTRLSLSDGKPGFSRHFTNITSGTVDYTPHSGQIGIIIRAMEEQRVCRVRYKRLMAETATLFYIKPLKLFSHKDTLYLQAIKARTPGHQYREPEFDPLLVVHRIQSIETTHQKYAFPKDYDFEKAYNQAFGVINNETFQAEVEFSGWSAAFVQERKWSPDQEISERSKDRIRLKFTSSSEQEVIAWVMSFGPEAVVVGPDWLREKAIKRIQKLHDRYAE